MSMKNKTSNRKSREREINESGLSPENEILEENELAADTGSADEKIEESASQPLSPTPEELLNEEKTKYAYLLAEYQNYRKRTGKDITDARFNGMADVLSAFLKVSDYLDMAEKAAEKSDNIEAIQQGLKMIIAEYGKCFDELGVKKLKSVGEKFDPAIHEAVAHEPSDKVKENHIIKEWNAGYMLGSRLLRPARVVVSSGAGEGKAAEKEKE